MKIGSLLLMVLLSGCQWLDQRAKIAEFKWKRYQYSKTNYQEMHARLERCEADQFSKWVDGKDRMTNPCSISLMNKDFLQAQSDCLGSGEVRSPASIQDGIRGAIALLYSNSPRAAREILEKLPESETRSFWLSVAYVASGEPDLAKKHLTKFPNEILP